MRSPGSRLLQTSAIAAEPRRSSAGKSTPPKPPEKDDDSELDEEPYLPLYDDLESGDDGDAREEELDDLLTPLHDGAGDDALDDAIASELDTGIELDPLDGEEAALADDREIDVGPLD